MRCDQLLGLRYRLGADGTDGEIDCIHMVMYALDDIGIPHPPLELNWYEQSALVHGRAMRQWGKRIKEPAYDGDVIWLKAGTPTFAVLWDHGLLYINQAAMRVMWCPWPVQHKFSAYRYCPMSGS